MTSNDDDLQYSEELLAHFGPGGPVAVALDFVHAMFDELDFRQAWALTDDNFRLCRTQAWLWNNRSHSDIAALDLDEAAQDLARIGSTHSLWEAFESTEINQILDAWAGFDVNEYGVCSRPRIIGLALELVVLVHPDEVPEGGTFAGPTLIENPLVLLLRCTSEGWRIANWGDYEPRPGWPPVLRMEDEAA